MLESMGNLRRSHLAGTLREENIDEEVVLMGWVQTERSLGSIVFVDLRDSSGIAQVVFDEDTEEDVFEKAKKLRSEFVIAVKGKVRKRSAVNEEIPTGYVEILAHELRILAKSEVPPIYVRDGDDVSENLRLKHRTLDLRKPSMQKNLRVRSKISQVTRNFFDSRDFVEVETPFLTKATPEGARDYIVPSRVNPGKFYALPQSPQLFKQLLMAGGLDKYYQIVKCFRDEDLRANRQPEFTQIDVELSFVDVDDVIELNEDYIKTLFKEVADYEIELPLRRLSHDEAMEKYGSDKPDTRFGLELVNISDLVKDSEFKVFSGNVGEGSSVRMINVKGASAEFSNRIIKGLEDFVKDYGAMGIVHIHVEEDGIRTPIERFLTDDEREGILEAMEAEAGDLLLAVAAKDSVVFHSLGALRVHLAKELDLIPQDSYDLLWVVDFPMFEYDEEEERYVAVHHPFTAPIDEDLDKLGPDKATVKAKAYDLVINGEEAGGGSIRISDGNLQREVFEALGIDEQEQDEKFGFLLEAFKYGVPPHGGIAYGLDRLAMIFTGAKSIRDVIAFPKTQAATDLLTGAPSEIDEEILTETNIKTIAKAKTEEEKEEN